MKNLNLILACIFLVVLAGCATGPMGLPSLDTSAYQAVSVAEQGRQLMMRGRLKEAAMKFEKAIRLDPNLKNAHRLLGVIYKHVGKYEDAINHLERAVNLGHHDSDIFRYLGVLYKNIGQPQMALNYLQKSAKLNPNDAVTYNTMGITYGILKQYHKSITYFKKAIAIDPQYISAYLNLGTSYINLKQYELARRSSKKALNLIKIHEPDDKYILSQAYNYIGKTYGKTKETRLAVKYFKKAVEVFPQDVDHHLCLARTYEIMGNYEKAIQSLKKSTEIYFQYGESYSDAGSGYYPVSTVVDILPAYTYIGQLYKKIGKYQLAKDYFVKDIQTHPQLPFPHYELGTIYHKHFNESEKALSHLRKAIELIKSSDKDNYLIEDIEKQIDEIKH